MGRYSVKIEEMICKVNRFLRQEVESAKKARMEGKIVARGGRRDDRTRQHQGSRTNNHSQVFLNKRLAQKVQNRH